MRFRRTSDALWRRAGLCLTLLLAFGLAGIPALGRQAAPARTFRAGAATSNVTPPLGSSINGNMRDGTARHIHDDLYARALALDDGTTQLALVTVDNCLIPREIFDAAKARVHRMTGLPVEHMLMSATHTHSAGTVTHVFQSIPDADYVEFVTVRIADAVVRALNNLEPARIGWGTGQVPQHVFNRRWFMKPGTIPPNPFGGTDQVKMNPPAASPDLIRPSGPTDPTLAVLAVQAQDGRPLAVLANYSLHYVGGTGPGHISADYFGAFAERVEELLEAEHQDPPFVGILSNGTSGNINNVDYAKKREAQPPYEQIRKVADDVAAEALRVYRGLQYKAWVPLDVRQTELTLKVRHPSAAELRRAKQIVQRADGPFMQSLEEVYARETLFLSEYPPTVPVLLQALQIGDLAVAAIPCEVFVEIGLELREKSPFPTTFTVSLANGYNGYLPTPEHHRLGGYETWRAKSSYLEVDASPKIVERLLGLFQDLKKDEKAAIIPASNK